ncbi:CPBP family intramembrane glutamic endopeptidase [Senegalia massiliensis]|uniref:CPBP family intramembrane metalloprotease n=1 Tax=Senegalia massiliensis TaxID=1720316 RepID=A0A845R3Z9_9CLOT|nr:type II CAAX endopeptidase family protein [Senegalia massiliensis]NBI08338.1 CPBP family intramembrane metalloprotease [Senegalia massiliensis]
MKKFLNTIFKTIIFFVVWAVLIGVIPDIKIDNNVYWRLWAEFIPFLLTILFSFTFVFLVEKSRVEIPITSKFFKNILIGTVIGVLWLGIVVAILLFTKTMVIKSQNNINYFWIWILSVLLNVIMQEMIMRGYLYQLWKQKYNIIIATFITTALFTAMHGGAFEAGIVAVLNVITMSIFITLLLEYTGTIIAPIIAHFIWNTFGAIILGGVSLASDYPNLLNTKFQGNSLLTGGIYKIEGSIVVLIINSILIISLFILDKRKKHKLTF